MLCLVTVWCLFLYKMFKRLSDYFTTVLKHKRNTRAVGIPLSKSKEETEIMNIEKEDVPSISKHLYKWQSCGLIYVPFHIFFSCFSNCAISPCYLYFLMWIYFIQYGLFRLLVLACLSYKSLHMLNMYYDTSTWHRPS